MRSTPVRRRATLTLSNSNFVFGYCCLKILDIGFFFIVADFDIAPPFYVAFIDGNNSSPRKVFQTSPFWKVTNVSSFGDLFKSESFFLSCRMAVAVGVSSTFFCQIEFAILKTVRIDWCSTTFVVALHERIIVFIIRIIAI